MRLICGLWNISGEPVRPSTLKAMCMAMQSPLYPGQMHTWIDGAVGFGLLTFGGDPHASAITLQAGRATASDLRLDEGSSLRKSHGIPASFTDAESVAALDIGEAAGGVLGDFAVAQWQASQTRLLLARDALGVRPLCYHHHPGRHVIFASLPSGVFASGLLQRTLDRQALARELLKSPEAGSTLFKGLRNVLPGHTITFLPAAHKEHCFWRPEERPPFQGTRQDAAVQLRELLTSAVNACLGQTGPVAAHLSGGLDSSALCVLASRSLQAKGRQLLTYSFLSETWPGLDIAGEEPFVQAVLRQEPAMQWQEVRSVFSPQWLHDQWNPDAPLVLSHGSPENAVCFHASGQGAGVVLSGWGGDEGITFNGRGAFAAAFRTGRWRHLAREMRSMRQERGFRLRNMVVGDVLGPLLPHGVGQRMRRLTGRHKETAAFAMAAFLSPEMAARATDLGPVPTVANPAAVQAALLADGHLSFRSGRFAAIGARYGMAFCFPLLNRRVVEFALSMPPAWHIHAGWKRRLFREAMEGILPPVIQWRHSKFRSLPKVPYHFAQERDRVLCRVEQLTANPVVSSLFRMEEAKAVLRALPRPDTVTDPSTHPALAALPFLAQLLDYAFFIEQHFQA